MEMKPIMGRNFDMKQKYGDTIWNLWASFPHSFRNQCALPWAFDPFRKNSDSNIISLVRLRESFDHAGMTEELIQWK